MRRARTGVNDVSTVLRQVIRRDTQAAAGSNGALSQAEQRQAPRYLGEAADAVRAEPGRARVTVDVLEPRIMANAQRLIGEVNQPAGLGALTLSKDEAWRAFKREPQLGEAVLLAYEVASGNGLDVDALAQQRASGVVDDETVFKVFSSEAEATAYQDPSGRQVAWLVRERDGLLSNAYVSGRNDLWAERFDIDRLTGKVTVTGEH